MYYSIRNSIHQAARLNARLELKSGDLLNRRMNDHAASSRMISSCRKYIARRSQNLCHKNFGHGRGGGLPCKNFPII